MLHNFDLFQKYNLTKDDYRDKGNFFGNTTDATNAGGKVIYDAVRNASLHLEI